MEKIQNIRVREEEFTRHYLQSFTAVAQLVKRSGGTLDDARDLFQDALVALYEKQRRDDAAVTRSAGYLHGIARNLWLKKLERDPHARTLRIDDDTPVGTPAIEPEVSGHLYYYIVKSGRRCLELLKAFYYERLSPAELAARFGFSGERSATVQKYKCLEKVRSAVQRHGLNKEDFYE